ncbi:MAG: ribonuclease D [Deferrisomatales bacterium]
MATVSYEFLERAEDISAFFASLANEPVVAVDLEADSLHSYREKVCLVQVSTPSRNAVVDPLPDRDALAGLGSLWADPAVQKVVHGGDYDVRLLKKDYGYSPQNLFDTMIAAQFAGRTRVGLAALLEEHFGVVLDKKHQRADWSARPLSAEMLRYAALDTAYLIPLKTLLEEELERLGRLGWAREEFALLERAEPAPEKKPWCLDVKGAARLSPRQLAVLQELLELRDRVARQWDRPPFKVLSNAVLLAWAEAPPASRREVIETPGAGKKILARLAESVLDGIRQARRLPDADCPRLPPRTGRDPLTEAEEKRLKRLKRARAAAVERLGLPPGLLVNTATLERLAREAQGSGADGVEGHLKPWQLEAVGDDLRRALAR